MVWRRAQVSYLFIWKLHKQSLKFFISLKKSLLFKSFNFKPKFIWNYHITYCRIWVSFLYCNYHRCYFMSIKLWVSFLFVMIFMCYILNVGLFLKDLQILGEGIGGVYQDLLWKLGLLHKWQAMHRNSFLDRLG